MPDRHRIKPGSKVKLDKLPTDGADCYDGDKESAQQEFGALREKFVAQQYRLYAENKQKLLIVLQAMDAGGKDGTIRNIMMGVNPQGVRVESFKAPSKEDLAHDYLWRVHRVVPAKGMITVFNRSHYEDVLVVRVEDIVPKNIWEPRFEQINQFEALLHATGTRVLKFYLHISKDEQKERFQDRLDVPEKHWKFDQEDLRKRAQWNDYMKAFDDVLERCSTDHAPWHAIPADRKWYRNLAIMRTITDALDDMNPQYPSAGDVSQFVID